MPCDLITQVAHYVILQNWNRHSVLAEGP